MRKLFLLIAVLAPCFFSSLVSADTVTVTQTVTVHATVAPTRYVVVNNAGLITSILSNTEEDVTPRVYLGDIRGSQKPYTADIQKQYEAQLKQHTGSKIGTLYTYKPTISPSLVSMLRLKPLL